MASIYTHPDLARSSGGLNGLDESMFEQKDFFHWGVRLLRDLPERALVNPEIPEPLLKDLMEAKMLSKLEAEYDKAIFTIWGYKELCAEIESFAETDKTVEAIDDI